MSATEQIRYVGPSTEPVAVYDRTEDCEYVFEPGEVYEVPAHLAHGTPPELEDDEIVAPGIGGLLEQTGVWELAGGKRRRSAPEPEPATDEGTQPDTEEE